MSLDNLKRDIQKLNEFSFENTILDILYDYKDYLIVLLKLQLETGKDGDGEQIFLIRGKGEKMGVYPYYSQFTEDTKKEYGEGRGAVTETITHYMTGDFYASLEFSSNGETFEFTSPVPYFEEMIDHTTNKTKIMELSQETMNEFSNEILKPELEKRYKAYMGIT